MSCGFILRENDIYTLYSSIKSISRPKIPQNPNPTPPLRGSARKSLNATEKASPFGSRCKRALFERARNPRKMSFASDIERGGGGYGQPPAGGRQFGGGGYQGSGLGNGGPGRDDDYNFEKNQVSTNIREMAARYQHVVDASSTLGSAGDTVEFRDDLYVNIPSENIMRLISGPFSGPRSENRSHWSIFPCPGLRPDLLGLSFPFNRGRVFAFPFGPKFFHRHFSTQTRGSCFGLIPVLVPVRTLVCVCLWAQKISSWPWEGVFSTRLHNNLPCFCCVCLNFVPGTQISRPQHVRSGPHLDCLLIFPRFDPIFTSN